MLILRLVTILTPGSCLHRRHPQAKVSFMILYEANTSCPAQLAVSLLIFSNSQIACGLLT
jgi:hypothetical protein